MQFLLCQQRLFYVHLHNILMMKIVWHNIYSSAKELHRLAPWEWMFEDDIFGVKIPGTDRVYFISVMGANGELSAVVAYRGSRALRQFWELHLGYIYLRPETILTIPHIMLSFHDRNFLSAEQLRQLKSTGLTFRGSGTWPVLEEIIPGYVPSLPPDTTLPDAAVILEQTLDVVKRTSEEKYLLHHEDHDDEMYLIRETDTKSSGFTWQDRYRKINTKPFRFKVNCREDILDSLTVLPARSVILQLDLVLLPVPIKEEGSNGYFPFILLATNKKTGIIEGMEMLTPRPDLDTMYESVPQKVLDMLLSLKYNPLRIEIQSHLLESLLHSILKKAGFKMILVKELKSIEIAVEGHMSSL